MKMWNGTFLLAFIIFASFAISVIVIKSGDSNETIVKALSWRGGGAHENNQVLETRARTSDSIVVLVETWHDLRIDPDKWNLPQVVTSAVRSTTKRYTVDSIVNYHGDYTTQIIRDAQWLVGNTNIRIIVRTVSWECPGQPLCPGEPAGSRFPR